MSIDYRFLGRLLRTLRSPPAIAGVDKPMVEIEAPSLPAGKPKPTQDEQAVMHRILEILPKTNPHASLEYAASLLAQPGGCYTFIFYVDPGDDCPPDGSKSEIIRNGNYITTISERGEVLSRSVQTPLERLREVEIRLKARLPQSNIVSLRTRPKSP